ncbi:hypothetical protein RND71_035134 [Anisodus tanguticus]|uniref:Uncharacterized protein n=1 Tax=Anisodus tanguticus TaxID=243964 RepID=A0AAE1R4Z6_9SOLA|nr:hypothetical protein RND71_035134 [Anisodus tanguticus]
MAELKKDLIKNLDEEFPSDTSMASGHTEEEDNILDSQDSYDADFDIEDYLKTFQDKMDHSSTSDKFKGKDKV